MDSPGPGWATIPEPPTSSVASSDDEMLDDEISHKVPQTLKRKGGPPPASQKRRKFTPPDEPMPDLPSSTLPSAGSSNGPASASESFFGLLSRNSRPASSSGFLKVRPSGASSAKTRVVSRKGKQKARSEDDGSEGSSTNSSPEQPGARPTVARKHVRTLLKTGALPKPTLPKAPGPSNMTKPTLEAPEIIELCSSDETPQEKPKPKPRTSVGKYSGPTSSGASASHGPPSSLNFNRPKDSSSQSRKSLPSTSAKAQSGPQVICISDSSDEAPIPAVAGTALTERPAPPPASASKPPFTVSPKQDDNVASGPGSTLKPALPRRQPNSQGYKPISHLTSPTPPAKVVPAPATPPPLRKSSDMDMSGLKDVLDTPAVSTTESAHQPKNPALPSRSTTQMSLLNWTTTKSKEKQQTLSSPIRAPPLDTATRRKSFDVAKGSGGYSRTEAIDLTLVDSDQEMASPSDVNSAGLSTLPVGLVGLATAAEEAHVPASSNPPLPKRRALAMNEMVSSVTSAPTLPPPAPSQDSAALARPKASSLSSQPPLFRGNVEHRPPSPDTEPPSENTEPSRVRLPSSSPNASLSKEASSSKEASQDENSDSESSESEPEPKPPSQWARKKPAQAARKNVGRHQRFLPHPSPRLPTATPPPRWNKPQTTILPSSHPPNSVLSFRLPVARKTVSASSTGRPRRSSDPLGQPAVFDEAVPTVQDDSNDDEPLEYVDQPLLRHDAEASGMADSDKSDAEVAQALLRVSSKSPDHQENSQQELQPDGVRSESSPDPMALEQDDVVLPRRRLTRSSRSSSDEPANFFADDESAETSIESVPTSPSPDPLYPVPIKTFGGFPSMSWKTYRQDLRNFKLRCFYSKDLPHSLHDHINQWEESLRLERTLAIVLQSAIQENTADDEPDAPPIEIINDIDDEPTPPWEFYYTNKMWHGEDVPPPDINALKGCGCRGKCNPKSATCACLKRQKEYTGDLLPDFAYDPRGRLKIQDYPIFECNDLCGCDDECRNRVVQHGRKVGIQIKKTRDKGWGVFNGSKKIYSGTFIGIYSGELLTDAVGEQRGYKYNMFGRTYLFDLDFHHLHNGDDEWQCKYTVDAYHAGNFTRFLNHSCDPNCHLVPCYINESNVDKPLLAVFSRRDIEHGEEICFSYHGDLDGEVLVPDSNINAAVFVPCACKSKNCRGVLFT